jgi:purine nucleosidase
MSGGSPFLIVDTDGGVDDVLALLLLAASGRPPDLVTVCFGNVDLRTAAYNVRAVLELVDAAAEVHLGAERPLVGDAIHARHIHGDDGLGGASVVPPTRAASSEDAVATLCRVLRQAAQRGRPVDLLTLGPLTNVALALRLDPAAVAGIGRLVVMGGTCFGRGNTTPAAEYNVFADPEAAAIVLAAGAATTIVPWEACVDAALPGPAVDDAFAPPPANSITAFVSTIVRHYRAVRQNLTGLDELVLPDPMAAAVLLDERLAARTISAAVGVELAGRLTRGMTVVDPSRRLETPPVTVVEAVDRQAAHGLLARILEAGEGARERLETDATSAESTGSQSDEGRSVT